MRIALFILKKKASYTEITWQVNHWMTSKAWNTITKKQVARVKQTTKKVLNKHKFLAEWIPTFFHTQGIAKVSVLNVLSMTISTIVLAILGVFRGEGSDAPGSSPSRDEEDLKKWLNSWFHYDTLSFSCDK